MDPCGSSTTKIILSGPAHSLECNILIQELKGNGRTGLSNAEAVRRLNDHGKNELQTGPGVRPFHIFLKQIANAMMLVLIMAMVVSFAIKSWIEGGVVTAVIGLNIVVGFFQEYNAEKTMDSLRSLSSPTATVVRDGETVTVPTAELVPGDLVVLKLGDTVPADLRLVECLNLEADEALLTGESLPVAKNEHDLFDEDTGPGDRLNVAYSSSTITKGRARGIVYATGMHTEIGSIADALRQGESKVRPVKGNASDPIFLRALRYAESWLLTISDSLGRFLGVNTGTPLHRKLSWLAILLFGIAVICALIVLAANSFSSRTEVIIYAVATGLSMIPASLIVLLTITMAVGTKRMVQRNVVVRKMAALEALGAVTDICSDKTGTLTQGKMVAQKCWIPASGMYEISDISSPLDPTSGRLSHQAESPTSISEKEESGVDVDYSKAIEYSSELREFLMVASLANLADVDQAADGSWRGRGDPTEIAIQVFASRFGMNRSVLLKDTVPADAPARYHQVKEYPFDSEMKRMSVIFGDTRSKQLSIYTKGAVERVLDCCVAIKVSDRDNVIDLDSHTTQMILAKMEVLASQGLRVLALASRAHTSHDLSCLTRDEVESRLILRGLIGLYDPPRPETAGAVRQCHRAGIKVHMLTGDHPGTARAIAAQVGILPNMAAVSKTMAESMVMSARDFDHLSDHELDALPVLPLVIARCAPNTKVRMIEALRRRKAFTAMTGDGVNDSPSLKIADVGIAMGMAGSDVAKDASDIVLTDDNFASILNAIEEGRRMFDNIQKFILHVLAENIAQACTLLIGLAFKDSSGISVFPLSPVQVLWIIMVTSGMPDMGLGMEVAAPDILERPPQDLARGVFTLEVMVDMVVYGLWTSALCISSFLLVMYGFGDGNLGMDCNASYSAACDTVFRARATTFVSLTWFALFLAWEMVNLRRSFFRMTPKSNRYFTQWMFDVWRNQFLFWAIIAGVVTIFPILYIPVLNHDVFKHTGISWEWGIVFVQAVVFFAGAETWKFAKRVYFRRYDFRRGVTADHLEKRAFGQFKDYDSRESV